MPKAKSGTKTNPKKAAKASTKASTKKASSKKAKDAEKPVEASDVSLVEEHVDAPAEEPSPAEPAAADSSADEAVEEDPFQQALNQIETLTEFSKASFTEAQQRHRTMMQGLKDARRLVVALKNKSGRKRKSTGKKTNTNSGITELRDISDQMRAFLGKDAKESYSYTTLCGAIMDYGNDEGLKGMKTTNDKGEEKIDNRYIRLDKKLKTLFSNYDTVQKEVAAKGGSTLLKDSKTRWVQRSGVMQLIGPHLLKAVPAETAEEGEDEAST